MREHVGLLARLGADVIQVRRPEEVSSIDGLVIPGGESSAIDKLSRMFGMQQPIRAAIASGLPVYGTCAGLILLADRVLDGIEGQESFGGMDIDVRRNAFGRQSESFETELDIGDLGARPVHATFIRAPVVERVGAGVAVLASLADGTVVAVEQGGLLGTSFHPEVAGETRFHQRFLEKARMFARSSAREV